MIMLSEQLEKKSKIGTVESITYIAHWLSNGTDTIDDMFKCVQGQPNIKISEVKPILGLFEIMSLIKFNDTTIISSDTLASNALSSEEFLEWFTPEYVDFVRDTEFWYGKEDVEWACSPASIFTDTKTFYSEIDGVREAKSLKSCLYQSV